MDFDLANTVAKATGQVMKGLNQLFTSDEERNKAAVAVEQSLNGVFAGMLAFLQAQEAERTERHKNDMNSDSWLSKNIRPLTLVFLTISFMIFVVLDSTSAIEFTVKERWIELLETLLVSVYGFYFVSRGIQACTQAYANMKERVSGSANLR